MATPKSIYWVGHEQSDRISFRQQLPEEQKINPKGMIKYEFIKVMYKRYNEKIGQGGKAGQDILFLLIDRGFIRLRRYKKHWTINIKNTIKKIDYYVKPKS
jgi:hypothetical protein